ncbi:late embryogenesis abundant protein At5g17165-like [Punica granatum]|uniref:Uncharacterized protein n=2 Tax=Punica granatum TaxID=22663 RepID=A0A2I0I650_PUNGR|nr:late embryogenesis abundant protein At5g17165-like [Punica granatum]PKI39475.1 hypothetical protein CRG98_040151 [Punica granatum]
MAGYWRRGGGIARSIINNNKRLIVTQIWSNANNSPGPALSAAFRARRAAHVSVYDKNPDEHVRPTVVPDEMIEPQSDKYWAPHPQTGVFGPAAGPDTSAGLYKHPPKTTANTCAGEGEDDSVLEQKAWFRPTSIEDLEKPATTTITES